jgi:hypothetical protein
MPGLAARNARFNAVTQNPLSMLLDTSHATT